MSITVPDLVRSGDVQCIVSVSGGKDSTATALALREAGVPARYVFADTGWEAPETYAYLDYLRSILGPVDVVVGKRQMVEAIRYRAGFPARMQRWCTRELKLTPLRAYHDEIEADGSETCCVVGVRGEESRSRAKMAEWEDDETWGGWMWRPILRWSLSDVMAIHHRHGVDLNPLYHRGHSRVGCYPCIHAQKEEIRLVAEHAPERIDEIRALEEEATATRRARNQETEGRYTYEGATFFQGRERDGTAGALTIDRVVEWSRTARGGKARVQLSLFPSDGGCFRWGLCEPPTPTWSDDATAESADKAMALMTQVAPTPGGGDGA